MTLLVFLYGFGKKEGTPVRDAPDDAALGEDQRACCASDPEREEIIS